MRHLLAAALVVSPLLVNAQTSAHNPQLAAVPYTAAANMMSSAATPAADRTQPMASKPRVSTGVVEPRLIHTVDIRQNSVGIGTYRRTQRSAGVSMMVDADGKPTEIKIIKSAGPDLDANILEAVSQYRFQPATVSGLKIAMPLNLYMDIQLAH